MQLIDPSRLAAMMAPYRDCLVGVSGGVDSMVLLHWLVAHRQALPSGFRVMHVDHGISPSSQEWSSFVNDWCNLHGVACEIKRVSLEGLGSNVEYAARQARYRAFCQSGADSIMLAHHANDQCESFFLKLFRGSGVKGLKAMDAITPCWYDDSIDVLRPMLNVTRDTIDDYAGLHGINNIEDPSNQDRRYDRNYIRHEIWPVIKQRFDIADINMVRSIQHLGEAWELTTMLADQDIKNATQKDGSLEWTRLRDLGYLRLKNVLLRILDLHGVYGFSVNHVEQFAQGLVDADLDSRNEMSLKGFCMQKIGKRIIINPAHKRAA